MTKQHQTPRIRIKGGIVPAFLLALVAFAVSALSQDLPDKIRGYKVHREKVAVSTSAESDGSSEAVVKIGEPKLVDAAVTGVTFELPAELQAATQSGKVDFLAFHDVRVNGISVEVEEYRHAFEFRKGEPVALPEPARVFLPTNAIVHAAWKEMRESKAEWTVTGRVFVFGRFRRYGFYHKRVIPIDINIKVENPIKG